MPANETAERLAAAAWIRFESTEADGLSFRSQVSTLAQLITAPLSAGAGDADFSESPLIICPLDRVMSRRETTVHAQLLQTLNADGEDYPWVALDGLIVEEGTLPPDQRLLVMPVHLDWIGDFANPSWLPFALGGLGTSVDPNVFDIDLYNALAFLATSSAEGAVAADIVFHIFKHPPLPAGTTATLTRTVSIGEVG